MRLDLKKSTFSILTILVLSLGVLGITYGVSNYLASIGKANTQDKEKMAAGTTCSVNFMKKNAGVYEVFQTYTGPCDEPIDATYYNTVSHNYGSHMIGWYTSAEMTNRYDLTMKASTVTKLYPADTSELSSSEYTTILLRSHEGTTYKPVTIDMNFLNSEYVNEDKINAIMYTRGLAIYSTNGVMSQVEGEWVYKDGQLLPSRQGLYYVGLYYKDNRFTQLAQVTALYDHEYSSGFAVNVEWVDGIDVNYVLRPGQVFTKSYAYSDNLAFLDTSDSAIKSALGYKQIENWYYDSNYTKLATEGVKLQNIQYVEEENGVRSLTIYAKLVDKTVEVTFDKNADDARITTTNKTVTVGSTYGALPTPNRTGYDFEGWYTEKVSYYTQVTASSTVTKEKDHTLYALWSTHTYYINYNANGGTGTMSQQEVEYNTTFTFANNGFSRSGYHFVKWNTKADGTGTDYFAGSTENNLTDDDGETFTLYAQWEKDSTPEPTTYKITYYKNDGTTTNTVKTTTGSFTTLGNSTWTRSGYTLNSWYTTANGSGGTPYALNSSYSTTKNLSLYAQWKANSYTVTFNPLGGSLSSYIKNVTYNQAYGTLPIPSKTDYTFDGWYIDNGTFKNKVISTNTYKTASNTTLYAKYNPITVEVTFDPFGGSVDEQKRIVNKNTAIGTLPFARKTNDGFLGWYTDPFFDSEVTKDTIVSGTMTLYAKYQSDIFTLNTVTNYKIYKNNFVLFNEKQKTNTLNVNEGYTLSYYPAKGRTNITYMGTGDSLILYKTSNGHNNQAYTIIVLGDANGDGMINSGDLYSIQSHLLNKKTLGSEFRVAADANKDNAVNSGDLYKIQSYLLGKSTMD